MTIQDPVQSPNTQQAAQPQSDLAWSRACALSVWLRTQLQYAYIKDVLTQYAHVPLNAFDLNTRWQQTCQDLLPDQALRRLRREHFALCLIRDVEQRAPLSEIVASMTRFAEFSITTAHDLAHAELRARFGQPKNADGKPIMLHIVGMGKLGGDELNVSSDIDLIFLYPEDGHTEGGEKILSANEYFTRLGKKIIALLNDTTDEGQVFRVDMRLRPHGESGPLVCSFMMLEHYLMCEGREWERYAWIKGRLLLGDCQDELQAIIRPFVFRKYLDFSAVESMRNLYQQIRKQVEQKQMQNNIKLGKGGIREIEFIVQVMQLMRGGRRPELQQKPTLMVLSELVEGGFMQRDAADSLIQHYCFLRRLEHRLQYVDDQQTQNLPTETEKQETIASIASSMDLSLSQFNAHVQQLREDVSTHFSMLFEKEEAVTTPDEPLSYMQLSMVSQCWPLWEEAALVGSLLDHHQTQTTQANDTQIGAAAHTLRTNLAHLGLDDHLADNLQAHARHSRIRHLKDDVIHNHTQLIRDTLQQAISLNAHTAKQGDDLVRRFLDLMTVLARRPSYLRMLAHSHQAAEKLRRFLSASSWGASYLAQHPILLDDLLDPSLLNQRFDRHACAHQLQQALQDRTDVGEQMNILRDHHHVQVFRLLVQDLEGILSVESLSDCLSDLADIILEATLNQCWQQQQRPNRPLPCPQPRMALIAYGKWGGKELGYASDLDVVLIREDGQASDDVALIYHKTVVSMTHWLSATTEAGTLFETDYRLRPDGESGQLVPNFQGFADYQRKQAWLWEHQALTRARFAVGDPHIGEAFELLRHEILCLPRDLGNLRDHIANMRQKMRDSHRNPSLLFDIKHDSGGLIDIEFIVQFGVLGYSHALPQLTGNLGNIALLKMLAEHQYIPHDLAQAAAESYRAYRRQQHHLRLNGHSYARVPYANIEQYQKPVVELWHHIFDHG